GYLRNLLASLEADQAKARELLVRYMPPLLMTPEGRAYKITGGFDLCQLLADTPGGGAAGGSGPGTASQGNGPHGSSTEVCEKISRRDRD
ncbi:MAG TPA: hypothetical protein VNO55_03245, partial [Polyangia bacterium]|nr:hypothetical protein [Polyangia bacterium]